MLNNTIGCVLFMYSYDLFMLSTEQIDKIEKEFTITIEKIGSLKEKLLKVFENCSQEEILCLKFYYAFMPVSDIASYNVELFLKIIKDTLETKKMMPWGNKINGELFLNYVLFYRINNENIVDYRKQFFDELYFRIKDKNMYDATLEVNYWCFEKATYKSTDIRTASPLTVLKNAFGRCGEESTLCVAALRSIGIPARQCYTPRWAHCDDNHAWIEAWIDGQWHFMGACEPEPVMDKGWFVSSAQRGMLIHSRVFSPIVKDDMITVQASKLTEVNILNRYTQTKNLIIKVIDENQQPISDVNVHFEVVNFSQLYPIANLNTDEKGECSLNTGLGDLFIHISKNKKFMHKKVDVRKETCVIFDFSNAVSYDSLNYDFEMCPPIQQQLDEPIISEERTSLHLEKMKESLDKRKSYENTFFDTTRAKEFAKCYGEFAKDISEILVKSNGNYQEIINFISNNNPEIQLKYKILILKSLKDKDFSDITSDILIQHLQNASQYKNLYYEEFFAKYILCPRVNYEYITPYRQYITSYFNNEQIKEFQAQPIKVFEYIDKNIKDCGDTDYATISASPKGLLELKIGSELSRKILFVAVCRTFGIPARLNPVDLFAQYYKNDNWITVGIENDIKEKPTEIGTLILKKKNTNIPFEYNKNFSIAILRLGIYQILDLGKESFQSDKIEYKLPVGNYRVITSNRQINGDVLVNLYHTILEKDKCSELTIDLKENNITSDKNILIEDFELQTFDNETKKLSTLLSDNKNIIAWLEEGKEPTEHLLNEMLEKKDIFKAMQNKIIFIVKTTSAIENRTLRNALDKMNNILILVDNKESYKNAIYDNFKILDKKLPLSIVVDKNLNSTFASSGYNVGIVDMLLKELDK